MRTVNFLVVVVGAYLGSVSADHWQERDDIIKREETMMVGGNLQLSEKEKVVNRILMAHKREECESGFANPDVFSPGKHFFEARRDIERSEVFKFIKGMPKGAALHGHDTALVSFDYLLSLTYKENLYACTVDERLKLRFMSNPAQDGSCDWTLISVLRRRDPSYDAWVRSQLTLDTTNPKVKYQSINAVWSAMMDIFITVEPLITYKPVFKEYFYQALKELHEDNVMYLEFRGLLPTVYDLNGAKYGPLEISRFYQEVTQQFTRDYPDFLGARFIYAPLRNVDNATADDYMRVFNDLRMAYPKFVAGFDLVGQEDLGLPLTSFVNQLKNFPKGVNFFFHSAETNWYGTSTDFNLVDAILLGTKRIGHGFGLAKHPVLMKMVKEKDIAVEICPISNQVLMLVEDMRNHPAAYLISQGFPVVIGYDDPSFWSTKGLSYDFYMTFVGIASKTADLKLLKQLSMNSITYSSLPCKKKVAAMEAWEARWNQFVDEVVARHGSGH